ncbi:RNA-editing ligase 1, mitochondrial-like isoform X2 [Hydractinia symbiolongicarpus]|nr:RNA-editing ligase 1, mitochondrial-like isoform X2 [Hydractinia symbiolongicarpus]XP_057316464.1 RNA-editing ligase 1, mitochondrial-like isoform X2 [Hydractinia symbiolongicarpus]XP_057316465.1 RNA-editing ligase 1, mitochondrial-like isoform X2 [Hydractinia symbiolongicarpus]XP_057316466.1 RNA-editing ligase 1, mitochondrial-like isoform X2 [Hydractinia symbiolongicarpus]
MPDEELEFTEYEKMNKDITKFEDTSHFSKVSWMVTEKIHGANFSFHTDGKTVRTARRRGLLDNGVNFFNCLTADFMKKQPEKMNDAFRAVCSLHPEKEIVQVSVYGELFGGKYIVNGKALHKKNIGPIQHQVQYSPNIEWNAFDISYRTKQDLDQQAYVDADAALKIFDDLGILYIKPLFIGPMNEALNYKLGFDSTIPSILGLPPLEKGTNKAEGIVVKPVKNLVGTVEGEKQRVIVKVKLEEFIEMCRIPQPKENKVKERSLQAKIFDYANKMRLISAISKIGAPKTPEIEEEIREEFMNDVFVDVKENEALQTQWESADEETKVKIRDIMKRKVDGLIKQYKQNDS